MKATHRVLVGAFLIGGVVLFGAGLFLIGSESNLFSHSFQAYAYFEKLNGLTKDAQVHVSGFNAGTVSDIQVPQSANSKFRLTLKIDQKMRPLIRDSSIASIASQGMVGDEFVEIDPNGTGPACSDGCTLQSKEPTSMSDLLEQGQGVMNVLKSTLSSAGQVANNANRALVAFDAKGKSGESGADAAKQTAIAAQRAATNIAEDADALKHNFFLRGFFKKRGFYDLGEMSAAQYRKSDFVKEKKALRTWLSADKLFARSKGKEELSEQGRRELDQAMSDFVQYLPNRPLMVEGYSDHGAEDEQYRESEQRATLVRDYLIKRFQLKEQNTGAMPLSGSPPQTTGKESWDGVSLVLLP